jgi:ATP-binding cassette subfamily C protein CydC
MSGGQKQRMAIARAILKNSPLLILDEALSNLDTENERLLQQSLKNLRKGRTTLIVAHRLSTFREADTLVVVNEGKVVETGNHADLVRQQGRYFELITAQMASG